MAIVELCHFHVHLRVVKGHTYLPAQRTACGRKHTFRISILKAAYALTRSNLQIRFYALQLRSTAVAWDIQVSGQSGHLQQFRIVTNAQIGGSMPSVSRLLTLQYRPLNYKVYHAGLAPHGADGCIGCDQRTMLVSQYGTSRDEMTPLLRHLNV